MRLPKIMAVILDSRTKYLKYGKGCALGSSINELAGASTNTIHYNVDSTLDGRPKGTSVVHTWAPKLKLHRILTLRRLALTHRSSAVGTLHTEVAYAGSEPVVVQLRTIRALVIQCLQTPSSLRLRHVAQTHDKRTLDEQKLWSRNCA